MKGQTNQLFPGLVVLVPALCLLGYGFYCVLAGSDAAVAGISIGVGMLVAVIGCALLLIKTKE